VIRLGVRVARDQAELALAELLELQPGGVEEVECDDGSIEYAVYGAPGELPSLPDLRAAAGPALVEISTRELPDDWSERWKEFHAPVAIADPQGQTGLRIRPPWFEAGQDPGAEVVIDPGQAFGTGAHATTRLALGLMVELADIGRSGGVLCDVGCGSGVLAIAGARLGWEPILAVDNDPKSLRATAANAATNSVQVQVQTCDLRREAPPPAETVVANLLRSLLLDLVGALERDPLGPGRRDSARAASVRDGTPRVLIASGLLREEADEVAAACGDRLGLQERRRRSDGDWSALLLATEPLG
jgi:ribosomal protein L11 methyltransferase